MKLVLCLGLMVSFRLHALAESLSVVGSGTVAAAIAPAIEAFQRESGHEVKLFPQPSLAGLFALADGHADIGASITEPSIALKELYPKADFRCLTVGRGAIYLLVSKDVWESGVRSLTKEQVLSIAEARTTNWNELGGPDCPITFIPPGAGSLANFSKWLNGKPTPEFDARMRRLEITVTPEVSREFGTRRGTIAALSEYNRVEQTGLHKISVRISDQEIEPTLDNIRSGTYPISFDLLLVVKGKPSTQIQELLDFLRSEQAQQIIEGQGYARAPQNAPK